MAAAKYEWAVSADKKDWSVVETETDETFAVTADLVGMYVKVTVTAEDEETASDVTTEPVGVYDELEIVSAEQTGANTALLKFSAPVTTSDTITIKKGSVEKTIASQEFADTTFTSVTVTMKDNFATGTYTATITPEDVTVAPSSVEFEAKSATKAGHIEIVGDKLVMKDTKFDEGYFFIKGYNEFEEEIKLSGLTINVGPSDSVAFDVATGKVTAKYKDPGYAVVRNVSVFASYTTADGTIITDNKTLEVSSIGYPSALEFGEIKKEGETKTYDEIELSELSSNKYYVEIDSVEDQWGNALSAEDLNDLVDERLLTVIPSKESPIFFGTNANAFSEKDGKVVVFLTPNNNKNLPGNGQLMITGAGGSFSKEVSIVDNSYIDGLTVEVPDLYEAQWSEVFSFSAVDEYGNDIDLYEFAPNAGARTATLTFTDRNNLTGKATEIRGEDAGLWRVKKDTVNKKFTVEYKPSGKAKSMVTFTVITAGMQTQVRTVTIGAKGTSAQIVDPGAAKSITYSTSQNIASYIAFKDANGKAMDRITDAARYPRFLYAPTLVTDSTIKDETIEKYNFYWTVTNEKLETSSKDDKKVALPKDAIMDKDGVIGYGNNAAGELNANTWNNVTPAYYVTLLGTDGTNYRVLDTKAFRFVSLPTSYSGLKFKVKDTSSMLLYAHPDSKDAEGIKVIVTNAAGETWEEDAYQVTPDAPFTSTGNEVSGKINPKIGDGTLSAKVYVYNYETSRVEAVDTVGIAYSDDDPVATTTSTGLATTDAATNGAAPEGVNWTPGGRLELETSDRAQAVVDFDGETLTITNATVWGDTFTAKIKDQYGVAMTNSDVEVNGFALDKDTYTNKTELNLVMTNGSQKIDLTVYVGAGGLKTNKPTKTTAPTTTKVNTKSEAVVKAAFAGATKDTPVEVTLTDELKATASITVPDYATLIVPNGTVLNMNDNNLVVNDNAAVVVDGFLTMGNGTLTIDKATTTGTDADGILTVNGTMTTGTGTVTVNGDMVLDGVWNATAAFTLAGSGSVSGTGHANFDGNTQATFTGTWTVGGDTLKVGAGATLTLSGEGASWAGHINVPATATLKVTSAKVTLGGVIEMAGKLDTSAAGAILEDGLQIVTAGTSDLTQATRLAIEKGDKITVETATGHVTEITAAKDVSDGVLTGATITSATEDALVPSETSSPADLELGFTTDWDALLASKYGLATTTGEKNVYFLTIDGPKQGGLAAGTYYLSVVPTNFTGDLEKYNGKNFANAGYGSEPIDGLVSFTLSETNNAQTYIWNTTWNGSLTTDIPAGTEIVATIYSKNDKSSDNIIGQVAYTVPED